MPKAKQEITDFDLMRKAVMWWRKQQKKTVKSPNLNKDMRKALQSGNCMEGPYILTECRPSVNVSSVYRSSGDPSQTYVVLRDHTGGQALPVYPVLAVFKWTGKKLVLANEYHPNNMHHDIETDAAHIASL